MTSLSLLQAGAALKPRPSSVWPCPRGVGEESSSCVRARGGSGRIRPALSGPPALGTRPARDTSLLGHRRLHCKAELISEVGNIAPAAAAAYGASLLGGGLFAFTRTGSKGSLGGGVTGGVVLGAAFLLMQAPETRDLGNAAGFGAALIFAAFFGIRLLATGKAVPSGILLGISALVSLIFATAYFQTMQ